MHCIRVFKLWVFFIWTVPEMRFEVLTATYIAEMRFEVLTTIYIYYDYSIMECDVCFGR
jgi:hypothetical protein